MSEATYPGYALIRRLPSRRRKIFEAIQASDPWRHVALTIGADTAAAAPMIEAARRLDHPGIARLVAEHRNALAIAWAAGRPLDGATAGLDDAHRLDLAIQIADLVAHAHQRGVVLGGVRPANLVLDRSDGKFHVTLVDLDRARFETKPTPAGAPVGLARADDLYDLGATLAFVCTGGELAGPSEQRPPLDELLATAPLAEPVRAILSGLVAADRDARRPAREAVEGLRALCGEPLGAAPASRSAAAATTTARAEPTSAAAAPDGRSEAAAGTESLSSWIARAELLLAEARAADALDALASCDAACGPNPEADRLRAHAWLSLDELELAIAAAQRALAAGTQEPALWRVLALAWMGCHNGSDAVRAVRKLARTGVADERAPLLAFYAALATDEMTEHRSALADAALAACGDDPGLALVHGLLLLVAGADAAAERALAALRTATPDLVLSRPCRLAIRGMTAHLVDDIEEALDEAESPALHWAAAQYYLAAGHPVIAASYLRDRPLDTPALAAEAFVKSGDRDGLCDLAPHLDDLAERVAQRLR